MSKIVKKRAYKGPAKPAKPFANNRSHMFKLPSELFERGNCLFAIFKRGDEDDLQ
jgi:hypothetical protein